MLPPDFARADRVLSASVSVAEILAYLQRDCFLSKRSAARYATWPEKIDTAIRLAITRVFVGRKLLIGDLCWTLGYFQGNHPSPPTAKK